MSTDTELHDVGLSDERLDEVAKSISQAVEEKELENNMLDLRIIGKHSMEDLKRFKALRADMVARRHALDQSIKIMDRRIEIVLDTVRILQTPI